MKKCKRCYGSKDVMISDGGVVGAEQWGTCPDCKGTGLASDLQLLQDRLFEAEAKIKKLEANKDV